MKFDFIHTHREVWSVTVMARVLGVTRQGYHQWMNRQPSTRSQRQSKLLELIDRTHRESNRTYGSPRITAELESLGHMVSVNTVASLMRRAGIRVHAKRRYRPTTDSSKTRVPAPNLLSRNFTTTKLNVAWLSDFTELPCLKGKSYAVGIMDLASRRILGHNVSRRMNTQSLIIALHRACTTRKNFQQTIREQRTIFHSDQGRQYDSDRFRESLYMRGFRQSMSGVGNCYDNAPMESFWATLKKDLAHLMPFQDPDDAARRVFWYINTFYNKKRRHSGIGYISPCQFEGRYLCSLQHSGCQ